MITLSDRPPPVMLSKTPAWFAVSNTGENKKVKATVRTNAATIGSIYAYASVSNTAWFDLSELFHHALCAKYVLQHESGSILYAINAGLVQQMEITFEDDYNNQITEEIVVLHGEITPDLVLSINYGSGQNANIFRFLEQNPVLSIRPAEINIYSKHQPERLFMLFTSSDMPVNIELTITFSQGLQHKATVESFMPETDRVYVVKTSYNALCLPNILPGHQAMTVARYSVRLTAGGQTLGKPFTYFVDFRPNYQGCFAFVNSLGGVDTFCPTGALETTKKSSAKLNKLNTAPMTAQNAFRAFNRNISMTFAQNTGYLSLSQIEWISQLIYSHKVYWIDKDNKQIEIMLTKNTLGFKYLKTNLFNIEINYVVNPETPAESHLQ